MILKDILAAIGSGDSVHSGGGGGTPSQIGVTLDKSTWDNVDEFDMNGMSYSLSGGKLTISGGGGTLETGSYVRTYPTDADCDEKVTITIEYQLTGAGAGIAITRVPLVDQNQWVNLSGYANHTSGKAVLAGSEGAVITNTVGHFYRLELKVYQFTHTLTLTNITTSETSVATISASGVTAFIGFGSLSGQYEISSLIVDRQSIKYATLICLGDSKTKGTNSSTRYPTLLEGDGRIIEVWAGPGDRTGELKLSVPLIAAEALPTTALVCMGRNDLQGIPEATWKANYSSSISQLKAANIKVIHLLPIPEDVLDQTDLKDYITSEFSGDQMVDPSVGWNNNTMLLGDRIHQNATGDIHIANAIKAEIGW